MEFKALASGSEGNCYLLKLDSNALLLDAGIELQHITSVINLNDLDFAFISHQHKDHSKSLEKLQNRGVYCLEGKTIQGFHKIENKGKLDNDTSLYAFNVEHGECLNSALIVKTKSETILYATDFSVCKWDLSDFKFTSLIIECNFIESWLEHQLNLHTTVLPNGRKTLDQYGFKLLRQQNTHLGLDGLCVFLDKLDLSKCNDIYLVHASSDPRICNEVVIGSKISTKYNIDTYVCLKNGGVEKYGRT